MVNSSSTPACASHSTVSPPPATDSSVPASVSAAASRAWPVPASNGAISKAQRPFQTSVAHWAAPPSALDRFGADIEDHRVPGTAALSTTWLAAPALNSRATTVDRQRSCTSFCAWRGCRARYRQSFSHSDLPTATLERTGRCCHAAADHQAIKRGSAGAQRLELVETLAPPTSATGRFGLPSALSSASSSACIRRPAIAGMRLAKPSVEACARWAQEKASLT